MIIAVNRRQTEQGTLYPHSCAVGGCNKRKERRDAAFFENNGKDTI